MLRIRIRIRSDPVLFAGSGSGSGSGQKQPDPDPASIIEITQDQYREKLREHLAMFNANREDLRKSKLSLKESILAEYPGLVSINGTDTVPYSSKKNLLLIINE